MAHAAGGTLLSWQRARSPFCLFGAAVFCEWCAYPSSLKRPEDKSERAPLRRGAGEKNRGRWLRSRREGKDERQEITAARAWNPSRLAGEGGQRAICPGENNHADSPAFHPGSILRRGQWSAEISRNKSGGQSNEMHHPELPPPNPP